MAYGISQARDQVGAAASFLPHSHSNGRIQATSVMDPTAHGNSGSLTHRARPGIKAISSWVLTGFITAEPQWEVLFFFVFVFVFLNWSLGSCWCFIKVGFIVTLLPIHVLWGLSCAEWNNWQVLKMLLVLNSVSDGWEVVKTSVKFYLDFAY